MSSEPIKVADENNVLLTYAEQNNDKMLGKPVLHINSAHSDIERIREAQYQNARCEKEPQARPEHYNWVLRPRHREQELSN